METNQIIYILSLGVFGVLMWQVVGATEKAALERMVRRIRDAAANRRH